MLSNGKKQIKLSKQNAEWIPYLDTNREIKCS